jgi:peptide/nickel transport system substrate-binding protein
VNSLGSLYKVPSAQLSSFASQWQALDYYAAQKAYFAVWGYASFPKFTSNRIDYGSAVLHQVYGWDWLTLRLK